jgi:protein translocase SecG subunit
MSTSILTVFLASWFGSFLWYAGAVILFLVTLILSLAVLVQDSQGGGIGGAFGASGDSFLGARTQRGITKFTAYLGVIFGVLLLLLSQSHPSTNRSLEGDEKTTTPPKEAEITGSDEAGSTGSGDADTSSTGAVETGPVGTGTSSAGGAADDIRAILGNGAGSTGTTPPSTNTTPPTTGTTPPSTDTTPPSTGTTPPSTDTTPPTTGTTPPSTGTTPPTGAGTDG